MNASEQTILAVQETVRQRMQGQGAGHDFDHVQRVLCSARQIQSQTGGDLAVIELAALLHDVGDAKFHGGVERSGEFSAEILRDLKVDPSIVDHVVHIVDNLSFRKRDRAEPLSLEGQIVQDADRLDALGAIGIVRTIEYGACKNQPFFQGDEPLQSQQTGVGHFFQKLFLLKELMNTDVGRRLAEQRESYMRGFLDQFLQESGGFPDSNFPIDASIVADAAKSIQ